MGAYVGGVNPLASAPAGCVGCGDHACGGGHGCYGPGGGGPATGVSGPATGAAASTNCGGVPGGGRGVRATTSSARPDRRRFNVALAAGVDSGVMPSQRPNPLTAAPSATQSERPLTGRYRWGPKPWEPNDVEGSASSRVASSREFECDVQHFNPHVDQLCGMGPFLMACNEQLAQNFRVDRTMGAVWFTRQPRTPAGIPGAPGVLLVRTGPGRCHGVVTSRAKHVGTGGDDLRRFMHVRVMSGPCWDALERLVADWGSSGRRFKSCQPDFVCAAQGLFLSVTAVGARDHLIRCQRWPHRST